MYEMIILLKNLSYVTSLKTNNSNLPIYFNWYIFDFIFTQT